MRRIHPVLVVILVIICGLALYIFVAKPVVVLPPITVALPKANPLYGYLRLLKIDQLDLTLRTNGRLSVAADGQRLAFLSYNLDSLMNSVDLAGRLLLPQPVSLAALALAALISLLVFFPLLAPQLFWSVFMAGLWVYFIIPVEITLRLTSG